MICVQIEVYRVKTIKILLHYFFFYRERLRNMNRYKSIQSVLVENIVSQL